LKISNTSTYDRLKIQIDQQIFEAIGSDKPCNGRTHPGAMASGCAFTHLVTEFMCSATSPSHD